MLKRVQHDFKDYMTTNNKRKFPKVQGSFFEQVREFGSATTRTVKKDLVEKTTETALQSIFGLPRKGELKVGQVLELNQEIKKKEPQVRPFELYQKEALLFVREQEVTQEVEKARAELKKAIQELRKLGQDVVEMEKAVDRMPVKPGIYHLTFFERLRQIIRFFRERIEESRTWLKLMTSKKRQKRYWAMYKKHGTQFGLSGERTVATQAG